jgi:hypothetical protein
MTRLNRTHLNLALTTLAVLSFGLRVNVVAAAGGAASGQGRHLGQEKKAQRHAGEQGDENEDRGKRRDHTYRFEAHERDGVPAATSLDYWPRQRRPAVVPRKGQP